MENKIISNTDDLKNICSTVKLEGKRIAFTNGCFDILHAGHVQLLAKSKSFADVLIVGINSDDSVKRLKGESRPVNQVGDRMIVLSALASIDYVIEFSEDTPLNLIQSIKPDVLIKGGDYTFETIIGAEFVSSYGGVVEIIDLVEGFSTTKIIEDLKSDLPA